MNWLTKPHGVWFGKNKSCLLHICLGRKWYVQAEHKYVPCGSWLNIIMTGYWAFVVGPITFIRIEKKP